MPISNRPSHFHGYEQAFTEIVPGVFYAPGDAVYIVDDEGEVVSWNRDEWHDDSEAVTATVTAVALAAKCGAAAVRCNINSGGEALDELLIETYEEIYGH